MSSNYFYQDVEKGIIKEELLTTKALEWAKSFISPIEVFYDENERKKKIKNEDKLTDFQKRIIYESKNRSDLFEKNKELTSAQLRRFYHDVKSLELKVKENFDKTKPLIKMLKSKIAYACPEKGKERKVPLEFRKFMYDMIDNINTKEDFSAFCLVFEAVVGYFYGEGGK